jgi:hypothetical protein
MVRSLFAGLLTALAAVPAVAQDTVVVPGTSTRYPVAVSTSDGKQDVVLKLTGVALRSKVVVDVYTVGSYLQQGATARTADELVAIDAVKLLSIMMARDVDGPDLIDAFKTAVAKTHPGRFGDEFGKLSRHVGSSVAKKGSEVVIAYVPGSGTRFSFEGKEPLVIPGKEFADAVWGVYLGSHPITDSIKKGLTARLGR